MFEEFPKIARLSRNCVITEKIDGTNASVRIALRNELSEEEQALAKVVDLSNTAAYFLVGSRTRYITPQQDNHGFAAWAYAHAEELAVGLGYGLHFGEWWGSGVQRGYGLQKGEKRFSLFNVARWGEAHPECCSVVPVLYKGLFSSQAVEDAITRLRTEGSLAAPGFMQPEGVVIYHEAARILFKKTLLKDEAPKGQSQE